MEYEKLIESLGKFGPYQRKLFVILLFPVLFSSFSSPVSVFFFGFQNYRCKLTGLLNDTFLIQNSDHEQMINSSIPRDQDGSYSRCNIIRNDTVETCDEWVYDQSVFLLTVNSQFNLVCEEEMIRSHCIMSYFIGCCLAMLLSPLADVIGRRKMVCISSTIRAVANIVMPFSPTAYVFVVARLLDGLSGVMYYQNAFITCMEFVTPSIRIISTTVILLVYCIGEFILVGLAYFIRDWRWLQLTVGVPMLVPLIYWWPGVFPESPRWLMSRGRHKEAAKILQKVAEVNRIKLEEISSLLNTKTKDEHFLKILRKLLKSKLLLIRWMIVISNWFVIAFIYFGLTINIGEFGGNIFLTFALSVLAEMIGYSVCFVMDKTGRKPVHLVVMLGSGAGCLLALIPTMMADKSLTWILISLSMIGKMGISAGFGEIYIYTGELFPTVIRAVVLSLSSAAGRIASVLSPYLYLLADGSWGKAIPLIIYGSLTLIVGLASLNLPETNKKSLLEQVEDANRDLQKKTTVKDTEEAQELKPLNNGGKV